MHHARVIFFLFFGFAAASSQDIRQELKQMEKGIVPKSCSATTFPDKKAEIIQRFCLELMQEKMATSILKECGKDQVCMGERFQAAIRKMIIADEEAFQVFSAKDTNNSPTSESKAASPPHPADGSSPFDLKGDVLGMKLSDFKTKYYEVIGKKHEPYCNDDNAGEGDAATNARREVVVCFFNSQDFPHGKHDPPSPALRTVANVVPMSWKYSFYHGQLCKIDLWFREDDSGTALDAFTAKYGTASSVTTEHYQNGFGAQFIGHTFTWKNPQSSIVFTITPHSDTTVEFLHLDLAKQIELRQPKPKPDM